MYGKAENAYNGMDFTGLGYVTEKVILESKVIRTVKFPVEDIKLYFKYACIFDSEGKLVFDNFKKAFFPQFYVVAQDDRSQAE